MVAAAVAVPPAWVITEPGIVDGMPAEVYHSDPVAFGSLSSSGARKLVPPKCPAKYRYGEEPPTKAMQQGVAAHTQVLGVGAPMALITGAAKNGAWSTTEAKDQVAAAIAAGQVPVKPEEADRITAMGDALREHKRAGWLFTPGTGRAEQSAFWYSEQFRIWRRCRFDWLRLDGDELWVVDYKTCESAAKEAMQASMARYGYHMQGDWYKTAAEYFRLAARIRFVLVAQEKTSPYLVECYEPDGPALEEGAYWNAAAMEVFRDCMETGVWPGYNAEQDISPLSLPRWGFRDDEW